MRADTHPLTARAVRETNRARILRSLAQGPASRSELARQHRVSNSVITNVLAELIAEGLVSDGLPIGERGIGRPAIAVSLVPSRHAAIGIHLGAGRVRAVACDLLARVIDREERTFSFDDGPTVAIDAAAQMADALRARVGADRVLGLGIAVPGPVDASDRSMVMSLNFGWGEVRFADELEGRTGLGTIVASHVTAMALAEQRFGTQRGTESLVFVYGGVGLAAGLISQGRPYRGSGHGVTGFGHLPVPGSDLPCVCGGRGCLQTVASLSAIESALGDGRGVGLPGSVLSAHIHDVEAGRAILHPAVTEAIAALAAALVSVKNLLDPSVIVVGGYLADNASLLLPLLRDALGARVFPLLRESTRLEACTFGADSGAVGAANLVLDRRVYSPR